jgi:hemoglobin
MADLKIRNNLEFVFREAGGADGIERILRKFYKKMENDILVGFFFAGKDLEHIIQQQKSFILRAMGAIDEYRGKSPKKAHEDLPPILKGHFDRRMKLLRETLEEEGLSEKAVTAWTNFENQFRGALIGEEGPVRSKND